METTRFVLLVALGLVLTMIYQSWQEDYGVLSVKSNKKGQEAFNAILAVLKNAPS